MKQIRFIISLLAVVLFSTAAWGINPTKEVLYRPNTDKTGWNTFTYATSQTIATPLTIGSSNPADFVEVNWAAQMFVIQQYRIESFASAKKLTLTLKLKDSDKTALAVWNFTHDLVESGCTDDARTAFLNQVVGTVGKALDKTDNSFTNSYAVADESDGSWTLNINPASVKPLRYEADGTTAIINLLITTSVPNAGRTKFYSSKESNTTNRPSLAVEYHEVDNKYPIHEFGYRFNESNQWKSNLFPKQGVDNETLEANYEANGIFTVEQFIVEDFNANNVFKLTLKQKTDGNSITLWDFPSDTLPSTNTMSCTALITRIEGKTGADVSASGAPTKGSITTVAYDATNKQWVFDIQGSSLTPKTEGGKTKITLLLTGPSKSIFYSAKASNADDKKPTLIKYEAKIGSTYYESFETAYSELNDGETLTLLQDITTTTQIRKDAKSITIDGNGFTLTNGGVKDSDKDIPLFIVASGSITLENIVLKGYSSSVSIQTIEKSGAGSLTLRNVTFSDFTSSAAQGLVCTKSKDSGTLTFDNISFENCSITSENGSLIFIGASNAYFQNAMTFTNCPDSHVFMEKGKRVKIQDSFAPSIPLTLKLKSDYEDDKDAAEFESEVTDADFERCQVLGNWYLYKSGNNNKMMKAKKITFSDEITLADDGATTKDSIRIYNGKTLNVTLNRTIARNGTDYATFSAPFAITRSALEGYLGETEVLRYKRTDIDGEDAILVFDDDVEDLEAGVPYLIKPEAGDNVTSMTFYGVTIDKTVREAADSHYRFISLFSQTNVGSGNDNDKSVVYLGAGNQLYWAAATCNINGFRAYFKAKNVASPAMKSVRRMSIGRNGAPTAIDDVQSNDTKVQKILRDGQVIILRDGVEYNAFGQRIQ